MTPIILHAFRWIEEFKAIKKNGKHVWKSEANI